jgi:hypothetical protein
VVGLSFARTPLLVLGAITLGAVLVLVLLSIPKLRWWERNGAREQPPVSDAGSRPVTADPAFRAAGQLPAFLPADAPDLKVPPAAPVPRAASVPGAPAPPEVTPPLEVTAPQPIARASGTIIP